MSASSYAVHDYLRFSVDGGPAATQILREQWQYFEDSPTGRLDLRISDKPIRIAPGGQESINTDDAVFAPGWMYIPKFDASVVRTSESTWEMASTRETGRLSAALIDYLLLARGGCLLHAAAVARNGQAHLITGWGGVGKTSSLAHLLRIPGYSFLSDDWVFAEKEGLVRAFPKPMYIYSYHRSLYPHLFESSPKPLVPVSLAGPVARIRKGVRPAFERFPRVEQLARKWSPEHMKVMPDAALPGVAIAERAQVSSILFLQRGDVSQPVVTSLPSGSILDRMVGIMYKEFFPSAREIMAIGGGVGLLSLGDWFAMRVAILSDFLSRPTVLEVTVPIQFRAESVGPLVASILGDS